MINDKWLMVNGGWLKFLKWSSMISRQAGLGGKAHLPSGGGSV